MLSFMLEELEDDSSIFAEDKPDIIRLPITFVYWYQDVPR